MPSLTRRTLDLDDLPQRRIPDDGLEPSADASNIAQFAADIVRKFSFL